MPQRVTTIVLNFNGGWMLPDCLESLLAQRHVLHDVVVADNGSTDGSAAVCRRYPVRFLPLGANLGFAKANNAAAACAAGDYLFFVNNDMRFEADCVPALVDRLAADATLFAVDPLQYSWDGTAIVHGGMVLRRGWQVGLGIPGYTTDYTAVTDRPVEVAWGCAGSLMVRANWFHSLGGWDSTFFLDYEDVDLCWRAWRRRWRTLFVPEARLFHRVGADTATRNTSERETKLARQPDWRLISKARNRLRFVLKVLDRQHIACVALETAARLALAPLPGRAAPARRVWQATWQNVLMAPDTWRERRKIAATSVLSNAELLRRFVR